MVFAFILSSSLMCDPYWYVYFCLVQRTGNLHTSSPKLSKGKLPISIDMLALPKAEASSMSPWMVLKSIWLEQGCNYRAGTS